MITISITNQKGGIGKTTTALNLGAALASKNKKVLLIDLDAQGNLSHSTATGQAGASIYDVLLKGQIKQAIIKKERFDVLKSSAALDALPDITTGRLKEAIKPLTNAYDFVIIDTPPALNALTINALVASDYVLIPATADMYALQGTARLYSTIDAVKKINKSLKILGVVLTRYTDRTRVNKELREVLEHQAQELDTRVLNSTIREGVGIREAQALQSSIFDYAPSSNQAKDYLALADEILEAIA